MGRDPITLTPKILHLLDRLEPDIGKQARLLTEHLTRESMLPATEEDLQQHMERKVASDIKRQHAAAEATTNRAIEQHKEADKAAHEATMAAHLAQQAMAAAPTTRATTEEAISTGHATTGEIQGERAMPMRD